MTEATNQFTDLRLLKETYIIAAQAIDKMKEPSNELSILAEALMEAITLNRTVIQQEFATFLYEDLAPGLAKRLHKERSNDETYLRIVADVLENLIRIFAHELKLKRFNYSFYSAMTLLFNHEAAIHKYHFQIADSELQKLRTRGQLWREELKTGDMVDVYVKADDKGKLCGWMQAQIASLDGDDLYLEFPLSSNIYDGRMDRWSTDLVQFETKTKEDYEWRKTVLQNGINLECDVHDKSSWNKSTVLQVKKQTIGPERINYLAYCALRVYRDIPNSMRKDERGTYEGWSNKFDEWVPVFSPRIMPWGTKVGIVQEEETFDDQIDDLVQTNDEFKQIFAVPRLQVCISDLYLRSINIFGNLGCFDIIIDLLANPNVEKEFEGINITVMGCLAQILTLPYPVFHKNFITQFGQTIADTIKSRLIMTSDQALRDVRKEQVDAIIKSIENISRRFIQKDERDKQTEILRLELCDKSLKSNFLERRIQGIKDFNLLIRNNTLYSSSKTFSTEFLIDWMVKHDMFSQIWDHRKTHMQIVQRTNEIFKLLLKENKVDEEMLKLFWSLTKSEYQSEVLKIISECSFYLHQTQIEFFFNEITQSPPEKLQLPEFDLLCDLGKQCKASDFQKRIEDFFWHIIVNSQNYKEDLVENSIKNFSEMIKYRDLQRKIPIFRQIIEQIKKCQNQAVLRLFKTLIKNQKDRINYTSYNSAAQQSEQIAQYSHVTTTGEIITSYSYKPVAEEESVYNSLVPNRENDKEITFTDVLNSFQTEFGIVDSLLENLLNYCKQIRAAGVDENADRKKSYLNNKSHAEEIDQTLQFLKYYASICDYQFKRVQLRIIYESLAVQSPIKQDQIEFLNWCKQSCQESTSDVVILDLNEVGEFFTELIINKSLDIETLPLAGFDFLQNYFITVNEKLKNLIKLEKKKVASVINTTAGVTWNSYYVSSSPIQESKDDDEPSFNVLVNPINLEKSELIWMFVLRSNDQVVNKKAIDFLIQIYTSLDDSLTDKRGEIAQQLITECFNHLQEPNLKSQVILRITMILKQIIEYAEKKGTGDVQPHNAILKGEYLDRIIIKNTTRSFTPNLIVKVLTSATVWEFVDKVSRMCDLAPQYADFRLYNGIKISENDYGKTLGEIGLKNHDIVTVKKNDLAEDDVPQTLLIDPDTGALCQRAQDIFSEWFDKYSNEHGVMTPESTTRFILGATNELVSKNDSRIKTLFDTYDANKDEQLDRQEFITFYQDAAIAKSDRVFDNIRNHYIRSDLVKLSEVYETQYFQKHEMPRHTLSHNQEQFDILMNLLYRNDDSTAKLWELIRMLETNQKIYQQVLSLQSPDASIEQGNLFWEKFFQSGSIYKQQYQNEIVEALMEDGTDMTNRVFFVEFQDAASAYNKSSFPVVKQRQINEENKILKQFWTNKFLENGGLAYVINVFLSRCNSQINSFNLKEIKFMLSILKVYVQAAITASQIVSSNNQNFVVQKLFEIYESGINLLESIDFDELQTCLLRLIRQIVPLQQHSVDDKIVIANSLILWKSCVYYRPGSFMNFLHTEKVDELVMSGLLYCTEENIRQNFQTTFYDIARNLNSLDTETPLGFLLRLLSKNFYQISKYFCRQFFELFNELIDLHYIKVELGTSEENLFNPEEILGQIIDKIRSDNREKKELQKEKFLDEVAAKEQTAEKERLMIGLVLLTQKIIGKVDTALSEKIVREKDLINEIFKEFLFSSVFSSETNVQGDNENMLDLIKHRTPRKLQLPSSGGKQPNKSREAAYNLLNQLIKKSPIIMNNFIKDQLKPLLDMIKKPKQWNYTPPGSSDRTQKYVGIRNLGCICYMNSMLQQFFMIPAFRYNLLCVDDHIDEKIKEYKGELIDDNMLHQLQKLFAHLELSERSDFNPIGFTFSFKENGDQPTNTSEQKDAQEFLNVLFDRIENLLKPTPRKYLLQSVFGGKSCSQLICPECGKVKNRIEDQYCLSLTVKDISSVYDSLDKLIQGEIISDFKCDGCDKKVDITKRTLQAETPNVLIVHLQRILFNFDTFMNDKLNQNFEFPTHLDLKPYSYYEVMRREHRLNDNKVEEEEDLTEEKKVEEDQEHPIEDDCFEYKLVGVNVHSGSANAGHYWSYINVERGLDEKDVSDPTWAETEKDQWMEFNDSTVKDYKFENLKEECFGDKPGNNTTSSWSFGGKYGKSGYMLFYERRVKKPIRIVVPQKQADSYFDEKTKEYIKKISYREGVDSEKPNKIFAKVLEDNTKFSFENDVYSLEFFDFIRQILLNVATFGDSQNQVNKEMRSYSMQVAQKAAFEILARCFYNNGIKDLINVMIQILEQDEQLVLDFTKAILNTNDGELMLELLLDCTDSSARDATGDMMRYLISKCKMIEQKQLLGEDHHKTVSANFLNVLINNLPVRAAKAWARFDKFLEMFKAFALESPQEIKESLVNITSVTKMLDVSEQVAAQVGLEYFFRINIFEKICDFILGEKSPMKKDGDIRVSMGSSYSSPNFSSLMKIISAMIGQKQLLQTYPLSKEASEMLQNKLILGKIVEDNAQNKSFGIMISTMCKDNYKMSKKLSKIFLKAYNQNSTDKIAVFLKALKKFLLIQDSLSQERLEWILGVPQLKTEHPFRSLEYKYGVELIDRINDRSYDYISTLSASFQPTAESCLLERILASRGRLDDFCIRAITQIMSLCNKNSFIAKYIYNLPSYSYQNARYTDWIKNYIENQKEECLKAASNGYNYYKSRTEEVKKCETVYLKFAEVLKRFDEADSQEIDKLLQSEAYSESEYARSWMITHPEVIRHWPAQVIIGKQINNEKECFATFEDEFVKVQLLQIECEYMYGNPTGIFNLSLSEKLNRTQNYSNISYQQFRDFQQVQQGLQPTPIETRNWIQNHTEGPVLLQILVTSKQQKALKVQVVVKNNSTNVSLPVTQIRDTCFGNDSKVFAHFTKIRPDQQWGGQFELIVTHSSQQAMPALQIPITEQANSQINENNTIQEDVEYECSNCQAPAFLGMEFCDKCNEPLNEKSYVNYY